MTRAKFKVTGKKEMVWNSGFAYEVTMMPVYDSNPESENGKFYASTPSGTIALSIINEAAAANFEVGKMYYVDFSPAE